MTLEAGKNGEKKLVWLRLDERAEKAEILIEELQEFRMK